MNIDSIAGLLLAAGVCAAGAVEVPNGGFEQGRDGRPIDWTLTKPEGGMWRANGGRSGGAIRVTGAGTSDCRWVSKPCSLEPDRCYAFSFWTRGDGSGSIVSGIDDVNVDWGMAGTNWTRRLSVLRTPSREGVVPSAIHLGQWMMNGSADFDDVSLVPVTPVYQKADDLELGHGEQVDGQAYNFSTQFGSVAQNHARPLAFLRADYNTSRLCLAPDSRVVYRFALPKRTWTAARVAAACGYHAAGSATVCVSRDGSAWTSLASITNTTTVEIDVPAALLPAKELFVCLRGGAGCALQIHHLSFEATFDGAPAAACGTTKFVDEATGQVVCETQSPKFYESGYGEMLPSRDGAVTLWRASSGWKIPRGRSLPTARADCLALKTAANEAEAVQLVVTPRAVLRDVRVTAADLKDARGHTLPAAAIDVLRVGYVPVKQATDGAGCRALWPDPLPPQEGELAVKAGENQPFWVRVKPPKGTLAGTYRGALSLVAREVDGRVIREEVPLEVEVFGFELPDRMTCETGFGFSPGTVARYHGLKTEEQRRTVTAKYLRALADHHISPYNPAPGVKWSVKWPDVEIWSGGELDRDVKFSGAASMRAVDDSTTRNHALVYSARVPLGRKGVKISFRYRTATDTPFHFSINHHAANGDWMPGRNNDFRIPASRDWRLFETTYVNYPAGAVTGNLAFYPGGWRDDGGSTGTIWVDEFAFTDVETGRSLVRGGDFDAKPDLSNAEPVFDWAAWDEAMEAAFATYHFNTFVIGLQGLGGGTFEGRTEPSICGVTADEPAYDVLMGKYLRGVEAHLREKGWLDKAYVYWFDEPEPKDYPFVMRGFDTLKRHAPGLRRMLTEEPLEGLLGGPNLWVPLTPNLHASGEAKARAAGDTFWWYVCCGPKAPYVTEFIDHPGTEMRLWLWQTWGENVTGVLIWETVWWTSAAVYPDPARPQNPYEDAMSWSAGTGGPWGNGDGRFLYPPRRAAQPAAEPVLEGPVGSFRLEMLRDGLEDYEYFAMLKRALAARTNLPPADRARYEALLKVPADVYTSMTEFATDPASMEAHRLKLARALEELARR
ncbi:MAG: glycoside hydrolase domain-containing protein [Kiritimatiellia bacterium]